MFSFMQNPPVNNPSNSPPNVLSFPRHQSAPSLDEFFIKLDESSDGNDEFTAKFKDII